MALAGWDDHDDLLVFNGCVFVPADSLVLPLVIVQAHDTVVLPSIVLTQVAMFATLSAAA